MKQIQIQLAINIDEAVLSTFAELIRLGVENGTRSMSTALTDAIKNLPNQRQQLESVSPKANPPSVTASIAPATSETLSHLIDAAEVSRMIGMSSRTVWRLKDAGKLPKPISIGSMVHSRGCRNALP